MKDQGCTLQQAIKVLQKNKIESFELMNVLVIPVTDASELDKVVSRLAKIFNECNYRGPWRVDPYYYESHKDS